MKETKMGYCEATSTSQYWLMSCESITWYRFTEDENFILFKYLDDLEVQNLPFSVFFTMEDCPFGVEEELEKMRKEALVYHESIYWDL